MTWPEKYLPFTTVLLFSGSFANDFVPFMAMSSRSLCVTCFSFPSNDVSFDFFFPLPRVFNIHSSVRVWKSFGAALIFVWSIQSHFSCFPFFFAPEKKNEKKFLQDIPATTQKNRKKVCKLFRHEGKKKNREFCHVVLLLIIEPNAEIPFAKAILQYDDDNVPSFLSFPLFTPMQCEKIFPVLFREFFVVVSCSSSFVVEQNLLHRIAFKNWNWIFILFAFSAYKRHTKAGLKRGSFGGWEWINLNYIDRLCFNINLAKVTFN